MITLNFQKLRDEWALKAPVLSTIKMDFEYRRDMNANPHGENYPNKKPRRDKDEIVSDCAYTFADNVLNKQYPYGYKKWMKETGYEEIWGVMIFKGSIDVKEY